MAQVFIRPNLECFRSPVAVSRVAHLRPSLILCESGFRLVGHGVAGGGRWLSIVLCARLFSHAPAACRKPRRAEHVGEKGHHQMPILYQTTVGDCRKTVTVPANSHQRFHPSHEVISPRFSGLCRVQAVPLWPCVGRRFFRLKDHLCSVKDRRHQREQAMYVHYTARSTTA
jgi:hypothetical protein